jgi:hypothetical protein
VDKRHFEDKGRQLKALPTQRDCQCPWCQAPSAALPYMQAAFWEGHAAANRGALKRALLAFGAGVLLMFAVVLWLG